MRPAALAIDARMLDQSGIGRYLRAVLPGIVRELAPASIRVLGDPAALERAGVVPSDRVDVVPVAHGVYKPLAQVELVRRARGARAFWAPHFDAPVAFPGKLAVTIHDLYYASFERTRDVRLDKRLYTRLLLDAVIRRADALICVSEFTRRELLAFATPRRAVPRVVREGVDASWFALAPTGAPPRPRPYLLYVGNVKPHKNVALLVRAFARIASSVPHDLVIAGRPDPGGPGDLARAVAGAGDRVVFTGHVDDAELERLYAHASALVLPSLYEGFGLPPLEAMAAGVPVACARAASLPEVCGDAAEYFEPRDEEEGCARALRAVLLDPGRREQLIRAGRENARRFDWGRAAVETAAILRELL